MEFPGIKQHPMGYRIEQEFDRIFTLLQKKTLNKKILRSELIQLKDQIYTNLNDTPIHNSIPLLTSISDNLSDSMDSQYPFQSDERNIEINKELLQSAMIALPMMMGLINDQGTLLDFYHSDTYTIQALKQNFFKNNPNNLSNLLLQGIEEVKQRGRSYFTFSFETDERTAFIEISLFPFIRSAKTFVFIATDITDRKQYEQQVADSEQLHRLTLNNIQDSVFITDKDGSFIYICPNSHVNFGYTPQEIDQIGTIQKLIGENRYLNKEHIQAVENLRIRVHDKQRKVHDMLVNIQQVHIGRGSFLFSCRDITHLMRYRKALISSEKKYRRLFRDAQIGIFVLDTETHQLLEYNDALLLLLGYNLSEIQAFQKSNLQRNEKTTLRQFNSDLMNLLKDKQNSIPIENHIIHIKTVQGDLCDFLINGSFHHKKSTFTGSLIDLTHLMQYYRDSLAQKEAQIEQLRNSLIIESDHPHRLGSMIGQSTAMQHIFQTVKMLANQDITLLITGETGTGKDIAARCIHELSHRNGKAFIAVNCGALPSNLVETELFGYVKGAFTGAANRKLGRFEFASGGTLFLDEVGDLPLSAQVKLLRVLEDKTIVPLGSNQQIPVDVRIIAATNTNLIEKVRQGSFREDLFYRLNVFSLKMPPLRKRKEDIPLLIMHFLRRYNDHYEKNIQQVSDTFFDYAMNHSWKGNIRELKHLVERSVIFSTKDILQLYRANASAFTESVTEQQTAKPPEFATLKTQNQLFEKQYISEILNRNNWDLNETAEILGITKRWLYKKIEQYHLH